MEKEIKVKNEKRIKFEGSSKSEYKAWAEQMWKDGYNYPISLICDKLGVSLSYIQHNILWKINYVVYDFSYGFEPAKLGLCRTCVNKKELEKWLLENATFERQTRFIDLYTELSDHKEIRSKALEIAQNNTVARTSYALRTGILSEALIKYLKANLKNKEIKNYVPYKRNGVEWIKVAPINVLDLKLGKDYYWIDDSKSRETFYRDAFINGDIKMKIGNNITIFIKSKQKPNEMKIPYLVPYGA